MLRTYSRQLCCKYSVSKRSSWHSLPVLQMDSASKDPILEGFTPLLRSPVGLDLKLAKRASKDSLNY